jgi:hypothetical protein
MPYALIPDDYTLKKVTKQQEAAVNSKRRHDDVLAFLENPTTPFLVGGALFTGVIGTIVAAVIKELDLPSTPELVERVEGATKASLLGAGPILLKKLWEDVNK